MIFHDNILCTEEDLSVRIYFIKTTKLRYIKKEFKRSEQVLNLLFFFV